MSDPSARVGTTVRNKWTLERLLGSGGMAAVYVGVHRIGRRDALKILHPRAARSKDICDRFEREAHAANRFRHPGAVEIRDIDVAEDGAPFLVMELLTGETLADREMRLGRIPLLDLLSYATQILDTLVAAHAEDIVHRDIKPGNLYIIEGGRVKVLDFGLARIRHDTAIQGEMTRMGLVLGTTPYLPPEQAKGRDIDVRADLFAVGATMFRMIARRHVHSATSDFDLLMKMANEPAPPLATVAPGVPRDVCLVVDRALAFDRDARYPDACQMLEDVQALLRGDAPLHATQAQSAGIDRLASTTPKPQPPKVGPPPRPSESVSIPITWEPGSSTGEQVPVLWSEPSQVAPPNAASRPGPIETTSIPVEWSESEIKQPPAPAAAPARPLPEPDQAEPTQVSPRGRPR